uniref:Variable lipoprotein hemagglutinin VlhA n=1 Tax=Mycoplasmopsis synoviae TaxID=2109 RepID=F2X2Z6_MYCSY|nr:variable lipoprotein hemagglutinin VlhA [Mycoplasmopsis synoviae]
MAISCGDQTPAPEPTPGNPNTDNPQNPNPGNPGGGTVDPVEAAKTEAKTAIDASAELSDSVKEALKRQVEATTTEAEARDLKTKADALVSAVKALSGSVTAAKAVKDDAEYSKVTDTTHKTTLEEKFTAAAGFLTEDSKLQNLDASSNLDTTKATLESAKTALDAAVAAVKPDLDFQKTKTSAAAKVIELDALVNTALKDELQRQVNALTKDHAAQATTMLENLTSLKESLESLQTLVSDGLKMQVDYPQKYYDADNKEAFDAALLKASSVFPAFQWTAQSIIVETPEGQLPNPRAWTKARDKSEFKLQNFVIAPAQAAPATQSDSGAATAASATVKLATEETSTNSGESSPSLTPEASTPTADLASTVSYLKTLDTDLKAQTAALNGDTTTNKTAYYKPVNGRTLYWDGFMPKITLESFTASQANVEDNKSKLQTWFNTKANWSNLEDQLVKKLGSEKFKNVKLTNPQVDWNIVNSNQYRPKVTFDVAQKEGYELQSGSEFSQSLTMVIRVLYTTQSPNANVLQMQGASASAVPNKTTKVNDENVLRTVNVYLNYTGPNIELDAETPTVGSQDNTSLNGTSNVDGAFNNAFRGNPTSGLLFTNRYANPLLQSVINYVNKFDPKFRAQFVTNSIDGVTITKVQNTKELRPGTLDDLVKNDRDNVFLQQIQGDTEAVYLPVTAIASNKWLNTFLIRIPLTKFVRPITPFTASAVMIPTTEDSQEESGENSSQADNTEQNAENQEDGQSGGEATETQEAQGDSASQSSPQT